MDESHAIIQDLHVSVSRAQEDVKYWEREANRWRFVAEQYFRMWYNDISGTMVADEQVDHEMSMFYKENFEDN
jgi:hypothetical protein